MRENEETSQEAREERRTRLYTRLSKCPGQSHQTSMTDYGVFLRIIAGWTLVRAIATAVTIRSPRILAGNSRSLDGLHQSVRVGSFRAGHGERPGEIEQHGTFQPDTAASSLPAGQLYTYTPGIPGSAPDLQRKRSRVLG